MKSTILRLLFVALTLLQGQFVFAQTEFPSRAEFLSFCKTQMFEQYRISPNPSRETRQAVNSYCECTYTKLSVLADRNEEISNQTISKIGLSCLEELSQNHNTQYQSLLASSNLGSENFVNSRSELVQICVTRLTNSVSEIPFSNADALTYCSCAMDKMLQSNTRNILSVLENSDMMRQWVYNCLLEDSSNTILKQKRTDYMRSCTEQFIARLSTQDSLREHKIQIINEFCTCAYQEYFKNKVLVGQPDSIAIINASLHCIESMGSSVDFFREMRQNTPFNIEEIRSAGVKRDALILGFTRGLYEVPEYAAIDAATMRVHCNCILDKLIERYPTKFYETLNDAEIMGVIIEECEIENHLFETR